MRIWKIRALKQQLATGALTEAQLFPYFFAVLTLDVLILELVSQLADGSEAGLWDYAGSVGTIIITLGGTWIAWRQNGGAAGQGFLGRYFPLVWVLTIRFLVFSIPVMVAMLAALFYFYEAVLGVAAEEESYAVAMQVIIVAGWVWMLLFYYRLVVHVRDVARSAVAT